MQRPKSLKLRIDRHQLQNARGKNGWLLKGNIIDKIEKPSSPKKRAYKRRYRQQHRETMLAKERTWRRTDHHRAYIEKSRETLNTNRRARYYEHLEEERAKSRKYYHKHKEEKSIKSRLR